MKTIEIGFVPGTRKQAIAKAIKMVKSSGRSAELVICRDIPGSHTGDKFCFCVPRVISISPEDFN